MHRPNPSRRRPPNLNLDTSTTALSPTSPHQKPSSQQHTSEATSAAAAAKLRSRHAVPLLSPPAPARSKKSSRALKPPIPGRTSSITSRHVADAETGIRSFLDTSVTPVDARGGHLDMSNKENAYPFDRSDFVESNSRPSRDSHDLSLPARQGGTRDSLMTNMLLSLDQLGAAPAPTVPIFEQPGDSYPSYGGASREDRTWTGSRKQRSNTRSSHATSQSSDFDAGDDGRRTRGHRSNSSASHFQAALARVNSLRSQPTTPKKMHSRKRSDMSSASNSIDAGYAQVITTQRWAQGFGHRTASFDRGHAQPDSNQDQQTRWQFEFSNSFLDSEWDAAPTPTVPGGPRRTAPSTPATAAFTIPDPPPEPRTPGLERKRSTRSRSNTLSKKDPRHGPGREVVPPMPPTIDLDSAPAPHVGYEKSKEPVHNPSAPGPAQTSPQQTRERPGFFKRMFGSSKTALSPSAPDGHNSSAQFSTTSVETAEQPGSRTQHIASQMKPHTPPSRDTNSSHSHHHVLQKKPSSFFRRRKRSLVEQEPPPMPDSEMAPPMPPLVPPISLFPVRPNRLQTGPEPSPVSSLRKVMDPYLKASTPSTPGTLSSLQSPPLQAGRAHASPGVAPGQEPAQGSQRNFSPEYELSPKTIIRPVEEPHPELLTTELEPPRWRTDTPTRPPPEPPVAAAEKRNNSFLHLDDAHSDTDPDAASRPIEKKPSFADSPSTGLTPEVRLTPQPSPSSQTRNDGTIRASRKTKAHIDAPESGEDGQQGGLALPIEGARSVSRASESTGGAGARSDVSPLSGESPTIEVTMENGDELGTLDEPDFIVGDPTDDDRRKARKIFDGTEDFIQREKAAAWMGEEGLVRQRTLRAYMELYDFQHLSILDSLKLVCERLVFRAETQQVDRILVAFTSRWAECNSNHGFKAHGK
jgi:hypothetical protein